MGVQLFPVITRADLEDLLEVDNARMDYEHIGLRADPHEERLPLPAEPVTNVPMHRMTVHSVPD